MIMKKGKKIIEETTKSENIRTHKEKENYKYLGKLKVDTIRDESTYNCVQIICIR